MILSAARFLSESLASDVARNLSWGGALLRPKGPKFRAGRVLGRAASYLVNAANISDALGAQKTRLGLRSAKVV